MSQVEREVLTSALVATEFNDAMRTSVINILPRFGCREVPSPKNLSKVSCTLALYHLFHALSVMNAGVPDQHKEFWNTVEVNAFYSLYEALGASPEKVLDQIMEPIFDNPNEERILGYLQQYAGEMKIKEAKQFLRFMTGSSVLTRDSIHVSFNALEGAARRPIVHTCSQLLELSYTYTTFLEFADEFTALLNDESCWCMYGV